MMLIFTSRSFSIWIFIPFGPIINSVSARIPKEEKQKVSQYCEYEASIKTVLANEENE